MNYRFIFHITGQAILVEAGLLLCPALVALLYHENSGWSFLITAAIALAAGGALFLLGKGAKKTVYAKEAFCAVSLVWINLSLVGALPFVLSGQIPNFIDALFETVSGFTTTGASLVNQVENLDHGILFWRSFTHWVGGMGILVFIVMFGTRTSDNALLIFRAEMPGPDVGKLLPKASETARILYRIYLALTLLEIVLLVLGGSPLFDSVVHAMGTAGTGGFGIRSDSIGGYSSYIQWVITIFMLLFGINFNLYFFLLYRKFRAVVKSEELRAYLGIVIAAVLLILWNIRPLYSSASHALRDSAFQVASIITTTGYSTTDFDLWPAFSKGILLILMVIGGCAGSTAGGLKVSRIVILAKTISAEIWNALHPRHVTSVTLDEKHVKDASGKGAAIYFAIYSGVLVLVFLLVSLNGFSMETNISATFACLNNVGPGFAQVGPSAGYALFSPFSKVVLTLAMLFGRLELYPMLICLSPLVWLPNRTHFR